MCDYCPKSALDPAADLVLAGHQHERPEFLDVPRRAEVDATGPERLGRGLDFKPVREQMCRRICSTGTRVTSAFRVPLHRCDILPSWMPKYVAESL